jgi:hypothetical protein
MSVNPVTPPCWGWAFLPPTHPRVAASIHFGWVVRSGDGDKIILEDENQASEHFHLQVRKQM